MSPAQDRPHEFLRVGHGPRAVEEQLLADLRSHLERVRGDPNLLAHPLVVVVPSRSLRLHVAAAFVRAAGPALVGVRVQTLFGLALSVHERAGVEPARGALLFDALVRRRVREERGLAAEISALDDGETAVAATLSDFLDAGFESSHAEALLDALSGERSGTAASEQATLREIQRARSLVRVAAGVSGSLEERGLGRASLGLRGAARIVRAEPLDASAIWIHGFTDATGSAADLLEALSARPGSRVYWDACADGRFGAGLRLRLALPTEASRATREPPAPVPTLVRASSVDVEVRAAAEGVRAAIAAGESPESIGVVARDLEPYRTAIRTHFARLAIPFSGHGTAGVGAAPERRARALSDLLEAGLESTVERWLDARAARGGELDLDLALRALGAGRIRTLAGLDLDARLGGRSSLRLPLRAVRASADDDEEVNELDDGQEEPAIERESTPHMHRRTVARSVLAAAQGEARALVAALERWPENAPASVHADRLEALVARELRWTDETPGARALSAAIAAIRADLPGDVELERTSFVRIAGRAIADAARPQLGGRGGGVQILSVVEARGRTFARLFVLGLNRGVFPRNVSEDPLLSDALRSRLRAVLPDLPVKGVGRDEERCLFDQIVRSAPTIQLSWLTLTADGKVLLPSPLLERIATTAEIAAPLLEPGLYSPRSPAAAGTPPSGPRPAHERAIAVALVHGRDGLARTIAPALREVRRDARLAPEPAIAIATARLAVLAEHEARTSGLGPYFGFVGLLRDDEDPRADPISVTTLEGVRRCGWQRLLTGLLGIEPPPDPLSSLPAIDPLLVGNVVHAVLEHVYGRGPSGLEAALGAGAHQVEWPASAELEALLRECAREALRDQGVLVNGLDHLVAERARDFVIAARELDSSEPSAIEGTLGSEIEGSVDLPEGTLGERRLKFRADRVDVVAGALRMTDYKTGRPISDAVTIKTRRKHLVAAIARGEKLQAMVYALAVPKGVGRYAFLGERVPVDARVFEVQAGEMDAHAAYERAVQTILTTWDLGSFFPRMLAADLEKSGPACPHCTVASACLRGDSGAHARLAKFVRSTSERASVEEEGAERALLDLWTLGAETNDAQEKA